MRTEELGLKARRGRGQRPLGLLLFGAALVLLASAVSFRAAAVDLHGPVVATPDGSPVEAPPRPGANRGDAAVVVEAIGEVARVTVVDGDQVETSPLLEDILGLSFLGSWRFNDQVGLSWTVPIWLESEWLGEGRSPKLGDVRLVVPVSLGATDHLSLALLPGLSLPTGDSTIGLGANGASAQITLAGGLAWGRVGAVANLGLSRSPDDSYDNINRSNLLHHRAELRFSPLERMPLAVGYWALHSPGSGADEHPAEAFVRVGLRPGPWGVDLSGGTTLTGRAGSANWRSLLALSRQLGDTGDPAPVPVVAAPAGPYDVEVRVVDGDGAAVDTAVSATGTGEPQTARTGTTGSAVLRLAPGTWTIELGGDGLQRQTRSVILEEGRLYPAEIDAVLRPAVGQEQVKVTIADRENIPVEGASVSIGGLGHGTTGSGGDLTVVGVQSGEITAIANGFEPGKVEGSGLLLLQRPPGSVKVVVRAPSGVVGGAELRLRGPEVHDPVALGERGERQFQLPPGRWTATVSAPDFGVQRRSFELLPGYTDLIVVDVVLQPVAGPATLVLRAVGPDGAPASGVALSVDEIVVGTTSNQGELEVEGLAEGPHRLALSGKRYRPSTPVVLELGAGRREVELDVKYAPGTLRVVVRGPTGPIPGTAIRFSGPESLPPLGLDPTGERLLVLPAGRWTASVSSPSFGLQRREILVEPDEERLLSFDVVLREAEGDGSASLDLRVTGPGGSPVGGARVFLDGDDIGSTASGGNLRVEGLNPGPRKIRVEAPLLSPFEETRPLGPTTPLDAALGWRPGVVKLAVRDTDGQKVSAMARFSGSRATAPIPVGEAGEALVELEPGKWRVVVSASEYRIHQSDHEVAGLPEPQPLAVVLSRPTPETASLALRVVDPEGQPVSGATVRLGEQTLDAGATGTLLAEPVAIGPVTVAASAPGWDPAAPEAVDLVPGSQALSITLGFRPRPVALEVVSDRGQPADAEIRLVGPAPVPPLHTDGSGRAQVSLRPGRWKVLVSAPELGVKRVDLHLRGGETPENLRVVLAESKVEVTASAVLIRQQVQFEFNDDTIRPESAALLDEVAATLLLNPALRIEIQGHTDNVGSEPYNLDLSERRARAVRNDLQRRGVDGTRMGVRGLGTSVPLAPNTTETGRTQNRRVQFVILNNE